MTDAFVPFSRALLASASAAGCSAIIEAAEARDWASATFTGQQHRLHLRIAAGQATTAWLAALPEVEWRLPRNLVAHLAVETSGNRTIVTALTIHEA
jgi:hypothetical protein